jgi:hypothetical protein
MVIIKVLSKTKAPAENVMTLVTKRNKKKQTLTPAGTGQE